MSSNFYATPKSSLSSLENEKLNKFNTVLIWSIGLSLISINSFILVFAILFLVGVITPTADFLLPETINLIDRTFVSSIYILSGVLLIKRKKLVIYALSFSLIATLTIKAALIIQADINQYVMSAGIISIISMVFILIYSVLLNKKRVLN